MDKYEFNIKVEQIKKLINRGDYVTAMKIADGIDWRRVRNASLLTMASQIYEKNEEYQVAKEILLIAFERVPGGKRILYKLTDLALKEGSVAEAEVYYREFCDLAIDDPRQYLLRYMILRAKKAPIEQLIRTLETYTSVEVDEKWMYELAELYHRAGLGEKCVATCDTVMLLFGLGKYVDKAMELKLEYQPLNSYQMDLVENRDKYEAKYRAVQEEYSGEKVRRHVEQPEPTAVVEEEPEVQDVPVVNKAVVRIHEDAETAKLAQEMARIAQEEPEAPATAVVEDDMEATRALDDLHMIKEIKPTQRVLDAAAERENAEIERQRAAIRAAKEREEMEAEALRRAEEEREAARREEAERRARREAEIARERALREQEEAERLARQQAELDEEGPDHGHLMIEAETSEEGLALAIEALKKLQRELGQKKPVAKISSEKLNAKGIGAIVDRIAGANLIIEQAAGLTGALQNELDELMERDQSGMVVVLIDTPANMEALHAHHTSLASKFQYIGVEAPVQKAVRETVCAEAPAAAVAAPAKAAEPVSVPVKEEFAASAPAMEEPVKAAPRVVPAPVKEEAPAPQMDQEPIAEETPVYEETPAAPVAREFEAAPKAEAEDYDDETGMDIESFAQYACKYAAEIDCSIDGKSMLALYERIEMMDEDGVVLTKKVAVDLIEEAADKAEKKTLGRRLTSLFSPAYDKDGCLILREKDFFD